MATQVVPWRNIFALVRLQDVQVNCDVQVRQLLEQLRHCWLPESLYRPDGQLATQAFWYRKPIAHPVQL